MKRKVGVLFDDFDPVNADHLDAALSEARNSGFAIVLMGLQPGKSKESCIDRWRMLVASCSDSRLLVPVMTEQECNADRMEFLQGKYPDDDLVMIGGTEELPSAIDGIENAEVKLGSRNVCCRSMRIPLPAYEYIMAAGMYGVPSRIAEAAGWLDCLFSALKPHRFAHSLSVAATSRLLAERFGENPEKAEKAGLLHDCAKNLSLREMRRIIAETGMVVDERMLEQDSLLHSIAGSCLIRRLYGVNDPEIIDAVASHNTGRPGMSRLSMCVCLADSIEPGRMPYPHLDEIRSLAETSLEKALLLSLEGVRDQVLSNGWYLHPRTRDTIEWLRSLNDQ